MGLLMVMIAVALTGFAAWTAWQTWNARSIERTEQQTILPAGTRAQALQAALTGEEADAREYSLARRYSLTGSATFLAGYRSSARREQSLVSTLRVQLRGEPAALASLRRVDACYRTWQAEVVRPELATALIVRPPGTGSLSAPGGGTAATKRLTSSVVALQGSIARLVRQADSSVSGSLLDTFALAIVRAGILLLIVALALFLLRRWINEPVEQLAGETRVLAAGELDRPVGALGPPELASLGRDVEGLRRRLRDESDELRQLRQSLMERTPLQALLRSELEPTTGSRDVTVAGRLFPAEGVLAGDWYDVWPRPGGGVTAALVDIAGHGSVAGLFALKIKYLLTPAMRWGLAPGEALAWTAAECGGTEEQFATGIVVELDPASGVCRYANAGHPSGLLFGEDGVEELAPTGPLLCSLPGTWRTATIPVHPGDLIVLTTDGVVEARLPDGSEFGTEGIVEVVGRHGRDVPPDDVAESLVSALRERCRLPLVDDATVVVVRVGPV